MAKYTLNLEKDFNFDLIGVCSHSADYKVCWSINEQMGFRLTKAEESFIISGKGGTIASAHSLYEWFDAEENVNYYLIQNIDRERNKYLIPEKEQIDFFLISKESGWVDVDKIVSDLKQIACILTAVVIDVESLKSAPKLLFD